MNIYKVMHNQRHKKKKNLQREGMVTLTNKQTPAGTHSYTQRSGDGQLCKYAQPSFLGSEWRSKHNSKYFPCCHLLLFSLPSLSGNVPKTWRERFSKPCGVTRNHRILPLFFFIVFFPPYTPTTTTTTTSTTTSSLVSLHQPDAD